MGWLSLIFGLFKGPLSRVLDTVDKKVEAETDREKLKADIIKSHFENRSSFMAAGGFVLMLLFAVPLAFWFGAVLIYSVFWCGVCAFPQPWVIGGLPPVLNEWAGIIIVSIFGVVGVSRLRG